VVRRSSSRGDAATDLDLVAVDPVTGTSIGASDEDAPPPSDRWRRTRRWRRATAALAMASLASALLAGWFGLSIHHLRDIERTWRTAMALDAARQRADRAVRAATQRDPDAARPPLESVGDVEAVRLQAFERSLGRQHILDPKVSALRDEMVEALRFRRFQMTPERNRIGNTPLLRVDAGLDDQLGRWGLHGATAPAPDPTLFDRAMASLRRYSSLPTGATLAAVTEAGRVVEIDVDADRTRTLRNETNRPADALYPMPGGVIVADGAALTSLPAGTTVTDLGGGLAISGGEGPDGMTFWVASPRDVRRIVVGGDGAPATSTASVTLPPGRTVAGATPEELILTTDLRGGRLERWNPTTGATIVLAPSGARFLAAGADLLVWQGPLTPSDTGNGGFLHVLHVGSGQRELVAIPRTDAASAAISPDGETDAVAAGQLAGRMGSVLWLPVGTTVLQGTPGPRVAVDRAAMTWAPDSRSLFWRTPDGDIAVMHGSGQPRTELLRTGLGPVAAVAAFGG
jgi:hypothetical protein